MLFIVSGKKGLPQGRETIWNEKRHRSSFLWNVAKRRHREVRKQSQGQKTNGDNKPTHQNSEAVPYDAVLNTTQVTLPKFLCRWFASHRTPSFSKSNIYGESPWAFNQKFISLCYLLKVFSAVKHEKTRSKTRTERYSVWTVYCTRRRIEWELPFEGCPRALIATPQDSYPKTIRLRKKAKNFNYVYPEFDKKFCNLTGSMLTNFYKSYMKFLSRRALLLQPVQFPQRRWNEKHLNVEAIAQRHKVMFFVISSLGEEVGNCEQSGVEYSMLRVF